MYLQKEKKITYKLNASLHWDWVQKLELLLFPYILTLFLKVPSHNAYSNASEKRNLALLNDSSLSIDLCNVIFNIKS